MAVLARLDIHGAMPCTVVSDCGRLAHALMPAPSRYSLYIVPILHLPKFFRQAASRYFANGLRARMCGNRARDTKKCRYKTALLASRWTIIIIPGLTTDTAHCSPQLKAQAPTKANRIGPLLVLVWFVWKRTSDVRTTTMGYKMKQHAPHGEHCLSSFT